MSRMRVTDLEVFVREQIYPPYRNELDKAYQRISTPIPRDLANAKYHLMNVPEWSELVVQRLYNIGIYFPPYIKHELVSYLKSKGV